MVKRYYDVMNGFEDGVHKEEGKDGPYFLHTDYAALEVKYTALLMAVASKYPNETRHQTALRYLRERQQAEKESADER